MKFTPYLCLFAFLSACASSDVVHIRWHKVPDSAAFCKQFPSLADKGVTACAWFDKDGICNIAAPDVKTINHWVSMAVLGHEVKHCFDRNWH